MQLSLIAAMAKNGVIGLANRLPWHLPEDLKRFRRITMGKPILMGRKTFDSLPGVLDRRENVILSRDPSYYADGCTVYPKLSAALTGLRHHEEVMIIGGYSLYEQCLPLVNTLYLTLIDAEIEGDTYFPQIDWEQWKITERSNFTPTENRPFPFSFQKLVKRP